ncbi:MAG TPA: hypothetical protein VHB30_14330 [Solirubrobacteraceae bacterium]|jgi:hypothetical protein|nr:hypothetical protein [Solirubrobacteraceae bacterium]
MSDRYGADRVGHGEASLGDAQSSNPPDDPDMLFDDAGDFDADTDFEEAEDLFDDYDEDEDED